MFRFFQKHKFHFLATLLCVFMGLSFGVFSVYAPKVAFAEDNVEDYATPEDLMEYCTNYDYDESQADEFAEEGAEIFSDYVEYDEGHLYFYPEEAPVVLDNHDEVVAMISANINAMNELVDEGFGVIDENWEFQPELSETYARRPSLWKFKLKWNKVTATFGGDVAVATSLFFLLSKMFLDGEAFRVERSLDYLSDEEFVSALINSANSECDSTLQSKIFGGNIYTSIIYEIVSSIDTVSDILTASNAYLKIIKIVIVLLLPSYNDCMIVLHNSLLFDREAKLIGCWIPTRRDRLGVSLKVA